MYIITSNNSWIAFLPCIHQKKKEKRWNANRNLRNKEWRDKEKNRKP